MRCFAAIPLNEAIRRALREVQQGLDLPGVKVRWVPDDQMHLTLKFLGETTDDQVVPISRALDELAAGTPAFTLRARGMGCFPPHGTPRVIWVGIEDPDAALNELHQRVETALAELGFPPERRRFRPHLTLGRVKRDPQKAVFPAVDGVAEFDGGDFAADRLILYASQLHRSGAEHTPLHHAAFSG